MKSSPFAYVAPDTVEGCVVALGEAGDEAEVLAGGQSLLPLMALRPCTGHESIVEGVLRAVELRRER